MTEIIFAQTRYVYDSYLDLRRLFELAGFPSCYVDEIDIARPCVYITSPVNGELRPHIDNWTGRRPRNAHIIVWNIERPSGSAGSVGKYAEANRDLLYKRHADEVWVSDRRLADDTVLRFVPLGSHSGLGEPEIKKEFDFCHMSYINPRRTGILKHFGHRKIGPNCWPPLRDDVLKKSRFALNVHQDNLPYQEPLRWALFAAYGLPIVSEIVFDAFPWGDDLITFAGYDTLPMTLDRCLNEDYESFRKRGLAARERLCIEYEFGKIVRQAVQESVGDWR